MKESKADIILHPVRMRIAQTLINGKKLTSKEIAERLDDIPQATLYRHLKKMLDANVIEIVDENQVRGTVEKVYALPVQSKSISEEEIKHWNKDDHLNAFMKFIAIVLADFERYVEQENFDLQKDGAGYRQFSFYATDEEVQNFIGTIRNGLEELTSNDAEGARRKRTFTAILTSENK